MREATNNDLKVEADRYLIFKLGDELYGTPLLEVREVGDMIDPKPVPNTSGCFLGVINIRGQIVGVVDLRLRFGHPAVRTTDNALMVFETISGTMAAIVDKVESVVRFPDIEIDRDPKVKTSVPQEFLVGVGHDNGRLVTLLEVNNLLSKIRLG